MLPKRRAATERSPVLTRMCAYRWKTTGQTVQEYGNALCPVGREFPCVGSKSSHALSLIAEAPVDVRIAAKKAIFPSGSSEEGIEHLQCECSSSLNQRLGDQSLPTP